MDKSIPTQQDEVKDLATESQIRESPTSQLVNMQEPGEASSQGFASKVFLKTESNQGNYCRVASTGDPSPQSENEMQFQANRIHIVSIESSSQESAPETRESPCINGSPESTSSTKYVEVRKGMDANCEQEDEAIDVTSVEKDEQFRKELKRSDHFDEIPSKSNHAETRGKQRKDQVINSKEPRPENDYDKYGSNLLGDPKESRDFPYFSNLSGVQPDIRSATFYPTSGDYLNPPLVYMPAEKGIYDREAVLRRAYYEDMIQQHSQLRSAFQKPSDRGNQELKFLGPAMKFGLPQMFPYLPFYGSRPAASEMFAEKRIGVGGTQFQDSPNLAIQDQHKNEHRQQKRRISEDYNLHESNTKYIGLDPGVPYQYLPYRAPVFNLDKLHPEAQCMYPCCTGEDKMTRPIDTTKLNPYLIYPIHNQALRQLSKNQSEVPFKDPNEMHPSFKEFLEAERQRLAADSKLTQEKQKKFSSALEQNFKPLSTWDASKKDDNTIKVEEIKSPIKRTESMTRAKKPQPSQSEPIEKTNVQITGAQGLSEKPSNEDPPPVKKIACNVCNKTFNRTSNLYTHMRTHSTHKPHVCEFCGKRFHQKADLRIHRYIHTGEKPHKCTKCGRGFKQLTHLKYHLRTHSDVRMYKCPYCEKGFNQKSNLQAHIFGHTGQRPHKCEICGKGFTLASTLNTHKRTHLPNKPFQCQFCERAFYQKNALKMHYVSTHPYSSGAV
ncbi:homeotic protein spalt-major [Exaiptasia diaphana]|uniref:C2H2-type domain-containing protein n=1 Tax=Exaiptasia diaphana TaxID=2652724 RepID=A0A913Y3I5_EXADI|nr:homeotic protein spalt-major [Exaiptasia diaphana]XP_020913972.1 homeotic protein spalt-major [Exaiptasia diaphana]